MTEQRSLQDTSTAASISPRAAELAIQILRDSTSVTDGIDLAARHLLAHERAEVVLCALTNVGNEEMDGWRELGGRARIGEWLRPGSIHTLLPPSGTGAEGVATMPWLSGLLRQHGVAAITDRELLPPEASDDLEELTRLEVRSLLASAFQSGDVMFGSMSVSSVEPGPWDLEMIQDFKVLSAAITARLALEQSRRSLAEAIESGTEAQNAHQQLFGAVGHELRTPVSAVLGWTEALLDDAEHAPAELTPGMLRDGPRMVRACEQLLAIIDSLLGAGRALATDDARQDVGVADALADVVHWHRAPALAAHVEMFVDVDPELTVWAHASGVRQVLANLLGNAITHHRADGGSVHLSASRLLGESGQPMVRIVVRDDGPGLEPDQLVHAFDPFVRFATRGTKGTGLGLSICRTIAERDGGAVRGVSTPGTGSSFWLELPAQRTVAAPGSVP